MHVATTTRRHGDREYTTTLVRQSHREGGKVRHRTLANLSHLPEATIELVRASLAGTAFVPAGEALVTTRSLPHGDVAAVWGLAEKLGFKELLGPPCRERDVALALICSQVVEPASKAAYATWWEDRTLGVDLGIAGVHSDEAYEAMDWWFTLASLETPDLGFLVRWWCCLVQRRPARTPPDSGLRDSRESGSRSTT